MTRKLTQAEEIVNEELGKRRTTIEYIEKELVFIKKWLAEDPGDMEPYLNGRKAGLESILISLK